MTPASDSFRPERDRTNTLILSVAVLAAPCLLSGCATPHEMRLARRTPTTPGESAWWVAHHRTGVRTPIVGIEHRAADGRTRQVLFCDRGVRVFHYKHGRFARSSAPLSGPGPENDVAFIRATLRHYQPRSATDPTPIPEESIAAIQTMADIVSLLARYRPNLRIEPDVGLTYRQVDAELEHCAHGAGALKEASKPF